MTINKRIASGVVMSALALAVLGVGCGAVPTSMGTSVPVAGAVISEVRAAAAPAQQGFSGGGGGVNVVGTGQAFGTPDQASVSVGVETFATTVGEATTQNQATVDKVMAALKAMGIADEDIQTANYSLYAEQKYGDNGPEGIAGYRVSNQVNVKIRDINQVGDVLAAATDAGANSIYGVSFSVADPEALLQQARAAAMADAAKRAQSLAQLGNVALGGITTISESYGAAAFPMAATASYAMDMAAPVPSINPGQLSFEVQVQVTYAIQ